MGNASPPPFQQHLERPPPLTQTLQVFSRGAENHTKGPRSAEHFAPLTFPRAPSSWGCDTFRKGGALAPAQQLEVFHTIARKGPLVSCFGPQPSKSLQPPVNFNSQHLQNRKTDVTDVCHHHFHHYPHRLRPQHPPKLVRLLPHPMPCGMSHPPPYHSHVTSHA